MAEIDIRFEREDREGVVAVGTYLYDAAGRLGISFDEECQRLGESDACAVEITKGRDLLSEITKAEIEQLSEERRKKGERLACQAKFEKSGEVIIMTKEKVVEEQPEAKEKKEEFKKEFEEMPLDQKIASLLELEAIALADTVSFVINSPYEVVNKVMDVMAKFGKKMEDESKEATRPEEHKAKTDEAKNGGKVDTRKKEKTSPKTATKKKTAAKKKTTRKAPAKKKEE
jgi:ferredoxin